jgi:hypothetical protein
VQLARDAAPEFVRLLNGFAVNAPVTFEVLDVGLLGKFRRTFEFPLFLQDGVDAGRGDSFAFCYEVNLAG